MSVLFSRKIKCAHCGKNFKGKLERGNRIYVCSSYDNFGKCKRIAIHEKFLLSLLTRRYRDDFVPTKENVQSIVEGIEVESKNIFTIYLKNDEPIIFGENVIQF